MEKLVGQTPLLEIKSLSRLIGGSVLAKCEFMNPGGSIKDRAALQMILDAAESGLLRPRNWIVEGTAGNTGIGLSVIGKSLGYRVHLFMPKGQSLDKQNDLSFYADKLSLVDPCPFSSDEHFYHQARIYSEKHSNAWWANQFENLSNFKAHFENTGPEIWKQTSKRITCFVSVAGTGGTISGCSNYLKNQNAKIKVFLVDPKGSGLCSYVQSGEFKSEGGSITEGIGIMRLTENFKKAKIDKAVSFSDSAILSLMRYVEREDGIKLGGSSALNLLGAVYAGKKMGLGQTVVTFLCDGAKRSAARFYNEDYLKEKSIELLDFEELVSAIV